MNLHAVSRHARLVARSEILLVQAKLSLVMRKAVLAAFALLLAGLGLVFLNMALFAVLTPLWGPVWTPAGLGLINVALAALAIIVAALLKPGPEAAIAEELRNTAGESLENELRSSPLAGGFTGGFDRSALSSLMLPALSTVISVLAKRKKAGA
jgi:hypothetical protein